MTDHADSDELLETRRRRARFRAWHRGMRETDLILGGFADREIAALSEEELAAFEALLGEGDSEILDWVAHRKPVPHPHDTPLFARLATAARGDS